MAAMHGQVVCATAVKNRADAVFAFALAAAHAVSTDTPQVRGTFFCIRGRK